MHQRDDWLPTSITLAASHALLIDTCVAVRTAPLSTASLRSLRTVHRVATAKAPLRSLAAFVATWIRTPQRTVASGPCFGKSRGRKRRNRDEKTYHRQGRCLKLHTVCTRSLCFALLCIFLAQIVLCALAVCSGMGGEDREG